MCLLTQTTPDRLIATWFLSFIRLGRMIRTFQLFSFEQVQTKTLERKFIQIFKEQIWRLKPKVNTLKKVLSFSFGKSKESGGAKQDRTADLLRARQALSQLSYSPTFLKYRMLKSCVSSGVNFKYFCIFGQVFFLK